jgi:hypothetical protein
MLILISLLGMYILNVAARDCLYCERKIRAQKEKDEMFNPRSYSASQYRTDVV